MKINYTNYCGDNLTVETDPGKVQAMSSKLNSALVEFGVKGEISATYYTDGNVKVLVDGDYYNMFNSKTGKFFGGAVGDCKG